MVHPEVPAISAPQFVAFLDQTGDLSNNDFLRNGLITAPFGCERNAPCKRDILKISPKELPLSPDIFLNS